MSFADYTKNSRRKTQRVAPARGIEKLEARRLLSLPPPPVPTPYDRIVIDQNPGGQPLEKTLLDVTGDNKLDAVVGHRDGTGIYWYEYPSSGVVTDKWNKYTIVNSGDCYEDTQAYDVNHDGATDLISSYNNQLVWFENPRGSGTNPRTVTSWTKHLIGNTLAHDMVMADLDGDGKLDIASNKTIYFQNSPTSWTAVSTSNYSRTGDGVALLDTGHGRIDLVGSGPSTSPFTIKWYENPRDHGGNARTDPWIMHTVGALFSSTDPRGGLCYDSADINGDGRMDIVTAQNEQADDFAPPPPVGVSWYEAPADRINGTWIHHQIDVGITNVHRVRLADANGDGTLEIFYAEQEQSANDRVGILYNVNGDGLTWANQVLYTGSGHNIFVADVDGDGDPDMLNSAHGVYGHADPIELYVDRQPVSAAPKITTQPKSQTVAPGSTVTFSVVATGSGVLSYQWQRDGSDIPGATASSYIIASTLPDDSGAKFRVKVSNSIDSVTSDSATLTVAPVAVVTVPGGTIDEGSQFSGNGSFTDASAGPWTATVNYGDGSATQSLSLNSDKSFALSHLYPASGVFPITVVVTNATGPGTGAASAMVSNVTPVVNAGPDIAVPAGVFTSSGSFTDPGADTWTGTVDYGDGSGAQALTLAANKTFALQKTYAAAGVYTVTVSIKDKDNATGVDTATATVTVPTSFYVSDMTPTSATSGFGPYSKDKSNGEQGSNDGKTITINGATFSKGLGVHAVSDIRYNLAKQYARFQAKVGLDDEASGGSVQFIVYGDSTVLYDSGVLRGRQAAKTVDVSVANVTTLRLYVNNGGDGINSDHADWADAKVLKAAPAFAVNPLSSATLNEGGTYSATGSFTDPGAGPWSAIVNYGDGSGNQSLALNADKTFALSHAYVDNGSYVVSVTVNNGSTNAGNTATATVNNVAPTVSVGPNGSSGVNFSRGGSFTDPGTLDTFTATVDYGDNTGSSALTLHADKTFTLSHVYVNNGTYPVKVTVIDKDSGSSSATANITITGGQAPQNVYVSDLNPTFTANGWGPYERDRSNGEQGSADGKPITLAGVRFTKGLGVHAASELRYSLANKYQLFTASIGVDDEVGSSGSVVFQVFADGTKIYDSGRMTGSTATKSVSVSVAGKNELRLIVTNNGDGINSDHADWANAQLSGTGSPASAPQALPASNSSASLWSNHLIGGVDSLTDPSPFL